MIIIKKRKDGRYRSKITLPNGQVKYVYGRTQTELKDKRDELLLQYAMGATNIDKKITVQDWAVKWWKVKKKKGRSSQEGYINAMNNHIFPHMGNMKLIDVKPINVQELLNKMGNEQKLSISAQDKVLITLNGMFKYAKKNGLISSNPAEDAELVEVPVKEIVALTPKQVEELLTSCRDWKRTKHSTRPDRAELTVHMGLFLGLRRGEIIPAQWTDIDEKTRTIHINRAVELVDNQPKNKDHTKTPAGDRFIPIPDHLWDMLQNTKKTSIYIIPSAKNTQMSKIAFRRMIEPIQEKLSYNFTFHQLRHTYATLLEKLGVSPKMCQYLLGHATDATTKKIYTHIQQDYVQAVSFQLDGILAFSKNANWGVSRGSNNESSEPQNPDIANINTN